MKMSETSETIFDEAEDCCQSCSLPFNDEHTDMRSPENPKYCIYCYADGGFTMPNATADDMVAIGVPLLAPRMGEDAARQYLQALIPTLERWQC